MVVSFGHEGEKCSASGKSVRMMTIVHEYGIHQVPVQFCHCTDDKYQRTADVTQLLQANFFPGSWVTPRTAFSIPLLERFHTLSNQSQISAHDFIYSLQHDTHPLRPEDAKVCTVVTVFDDCNVDDCLGSRT